MRESIEKNLRNKRGKVKHASVKKLLKEEIKRKRG
jgi:hypothetical protein